MSASKTKLFTKIYVMRSEDYQLFLAKILLNRINQKCLLPRGNVVSFRQNLHIGMLNGALITVILKAMQAIFQRMVRSLQGIL
jgi:hypothetical protein